MNDTQHSASENLPILQDERIEVIERAVFADISRDRSAHRARRGRRWLVGSAAAAVIVVAAVIAPTVGGLVGSTSMGDSAVAPDGPHVATEGDIAQDGTGVSESSQLEAAPDSRSQADGGEYADTATADADRDIITTASATLLIDADQKPSEVAQELAAAAETRGGYVESLTVGDSAGIVTVDPNSSTLYDSMPYPYPPSGTSITVRVPTDQLTTMVDDLSTLGEVTASAVNRQDVTTTTVDLRARVDAAQASVDRITEIMAQAGSVGDVIAAESALAERQATLESYQQQLLYFDDQVALSTLTVTVISPSTAVAADPAGFGDGLAAGWNGLVATLNGIVVALGFLLPWIVVIVAAAAIVWVIVRVVRTRKPRAERTVDDVQ